MMPNRSTTTEELSGTAAAARDFLLLPEVAGGTDDRIAEVLAEIERTGTYVQSLRELEIGAKIAWRNHARCIGRVHWPALQVLDARDCVTGPQIAAACWHHLRASTNGGRIRPIITVFPPRRPGETPIEFRNPQLIRYAGYRQADGGVLGDPEHVELTRQAQELGWQGAGTPFDVLPLIIDLPDGSVHVEEVPADCILEIPIVHPELDFVADLGLRWHANPAISSTVLELGGLSYTAAPFTGWYVSSEIGARNFSDTDRYDMLPAIAKGMGLDCTSNRTLWRDRALVELNRAVLYSYQIAGVKIVDHHTASDQFVRHVDREHAAGRPAPADWSWVNPPMSSATTATFRREFDAPALDLRPNFTRRVDVTAAQCPVAHT